MRITILTQPLRANYGGILQNYAITQVLIGLGHTPTTIEKDYHQHISIIRLIIEFPKRFFAKYILKKREYILSERANNIYQQKRRKLTLPFIREYINNTFITDYNSIDVSLYDAFIVGSDQVWRPLYNWGEIEKMFLSFIPKEKKIKRISYAASFGTDQWEYTPEETTKCKELLSRFDAVSVRELDGIDLCKKYFKRENVVCVLDPTLLLDRKDYEKLCEKVPANEKNILCAYILDLNDDIEHKLKTIADKKKLKLKIVSADNNCTLTVPEWLAMFRDAKCIITDSFHGTVFSIIFNKEFYSIANIERGGSRFTSLLSQFDLMSRLHVSINEISLVEDTIINWDTINSKRDELKEFSINFLISSLI